MPANLVVCREFSNAALQLNSTSDYVQAQRQTPYGATQSMTLQGIEGLVTQEELLGIMEGGSRVDDHWWICNTCAQRYDLLSNNAATLIRAHKMSHVEDPPLPAHIVEGGRVSKENDCWYCGECERKIWLKSKHPKSNITRHKKEAHGSKRWICSACAHFSLGGSYTRYEGLKDHIDNLHPSFSAPSTAKDAFHNGYEHNESNYYPGPEERVFEEKDSKSIKRSTTVADT